jgi:MFS family permease
LIFSGMLGCIIIPIISDKIGRRKPFLILASLIGALSVTFLIFAKGYSMNLVNGIVLGFFLISALPIMLTLSTEITGARFAGISVGFLQFLGNGAAVVIVAVMELLRGATNQFVLPLALLVILLVISFILAILIKEPAKNTSQSRL